MAVPSWSDYSSIISQGLQPQTAKPARVIVIGAGMAGLTAAYELQRAGHEPIILEAQERVGGRVHTLRDDFASGLYGEAGAMRIPLAHALTMGYARHFGLRLLPFTFPNPRGYYYLFGRRLRMSFAEAHADTLGFDVAAHEAGRTVSQLLESTLRPITQTLRREGEAAWPELEAKCDRYSTRGFLQANGWSDGAVEMFAVLLNQEALLDDSFLEFLREEMGECYAGLHYIEGGMGRLPDAFLPALGQHIQLGARVVAIEQSADAVTVYHERAGVPAQVKADFAILTVPFSVLRRIEMLQPLSRGKQRAIRELHYESSVKIFLQFRRRFWEEEEAIFGGQSITDLPVRAIYYPDHGRETGRGVLLASYTWGEDAQRWAALAPDQRIQLALRDVSRIHPRAAEEFESGVSKVWQSDEFASGAFAELAPGQHSRLHEHITAPEGRLHFAGEHASCLHAWIQGAIQSGLRAAREVHARTLA